MENITFNINCSNNENLRITVSEKFVNPLNKDERFIFFAIYLCLATVSVLANVWSLAVLPARAYQTLYKLCLASLSASDLLLCIVVSLDNALRLYTPTLEWLLGEMMCSLVPFLSTACVLSSSLTVTCVAIDRYIALQAVREYFKPGIKIGFAIIIIIWFISFGVSVPMYLDYTIITCCLIASVDQLFYCSSCPTVCKSSQDIVYFSIIYAVIFIPLLIVFVLSYIMIARYAWKARQRKGKPSQSSMATDTTDSATAATNSVPYMPRKASSKKKLRTFKIVLIIMATFLLCRLPQFTFNLATTATSISEHSAYIWRYILSILLVANTAVNPILYSFLDDVLKFGRRIGYGFSGFVHSLGQALNCRKKGYNISQ